MTERPLRTLVLGAYGFFGSRICTALARNPRVQLVLAGRDLDKATALAYQLGLTADHARRADATDPRLGSWMRKLGIQVLIHTVGPFQEQDYTVARAAIDAGCHYLDLADGRAFVTGISQLDAPARAANVAVLSGVSSLPALSSAVVDRYLPHFSRLDVIRIGITSGAVVPGIATMRAVLGYCGRPVRVWENGAWKVVHGWLDTQLHEFPKSVGPRRLGRCDIPDLDLLPQRYPGVKTVSFHAGFASHTAHKFVELLARWVRDKRISSAVPLARPLLRLGQWLRPLFSDRGAMFVTLEGLDADGDALTLTWNLVARDNHGPNIPCAAAVALTGKIAAGAEIAPGARPCLGMLSVEELLAPLEGLSIREMPPPQSSR
jgi:saccharopine dehydrogenase-like NADP-dependent oxidoreductase